MSVEELQGKMRSVEHQIESLIETLQNEHVDVLDVEVNRIEITSKADSYERFFFKVKIQTKIR